MQKIYEIVDASGPICFSEGAMNGEVDWLKKFYSKISDTYSHRVCEDDLFEKHLGWSPELVSLIKSNLEKVTLFEM